MVFSLPVFPISLFFINFATYWKYEQDNDIIYGIR